MKIALPTSLFVGVFFLSLIMNQYPDLPPRLGYAPDLMIGCIALFVGLRLIATGNIATIPMKYIGVFLGFVYVTIAGALINGVSPDVIFAGIRTYFKYVPIFLLPFAYNYERADLRKMLGLMLGLLVIQTPLTLWQRFSEFSNVFTGDSVTGSLATTAALAVFCSMCIVAALCYLLDKRISMVTAAVLCLLAIFPTSLGETKVTPFFLIVGAAGILIARWGSVSKQQLIMLSSVGVLVMGLFVGIYDVLYSRDDGNTGFLGLITDKERMFDNYNYKGITANPFEPIRENPHVVGTQVEEYASEPVDVGRLDALRMPVDSLMMHAPLRFLFGLGIGNTDSSFGEGAVYRYVKFELGGASTGLSFLMWETGILGTLFYLLFMYFVSRDSLALSREASLTGTFGAAVFACTTIVFLNIIYTNMFHQQTVPIMFAFFGGIAVAQLSRTRMAPVPEKERPVAGIPISPISHETAARSR